VSGILQLATLLDVDLDPTEEIIESFGALAPAVRLMSSEDSVVPERTTVVHGTIRRPEIVLINQTSSDPTSEQQLTKS
jgi:hypothetical protein